MMRFKLNTVMTFTIFLIRRNVVLAVTSLEDNSLNQNSPSSIYEAGHPVLNIPSASSYLFAKSKSMNIEHELEENNIMLPEDMITNSQKEVILHMNKNSGENDEILRIILPDSYKKNSRHRFHKKLVIESTSIDSNNSSLKTYLGKEARLDCIVRNPGKSSVSWMRQIGEVLELITYDNHIYANDNRYKLESNSAATWKRFELVINSTVLTDAGLYRCQVAMTPPIFQDSHLEIVAPRVRIVDERDSDVEEKHYNSGSMIQLKCFIDGVPFPSDNIFWKKGKTVLMFNTSIGGISIKEDPITGLVTSRLYVANASPKDSGTYSCWYKNYTSDDIAVHVIAGEHPAAMQHDNLPDESTTSTSKSTNINSSNDNILFIVCILSCICILIFNSTFLILPIAFSSTKVGENFDHLIQFNENCIKLKQYY